jgi:hypothetical protein
MDPTPETAPARMWRPVPRHFRGSMGKSAKSLGYHGLGVDMSQKMKFLQFYMIIKHGDSSITIWNKENGNNEYGWYNGLVWINSNITDRSKTGLRVHWTLKNPGPIRTWPSLFGTVRWPNVPMAWSRQPDHCTVSCTPGIFIYVRFFTMLPTNFSPWNCPKMDSSSNHQIMAEWIPAGMLTPWHRHLRHEDNAPVRTILAAKNDDELSKIWGESTGMACAAWIFSLFGLLACPFMTKKSKHLPSLTYQTGVQPLWFPCFPARHAMWAMCQVSRLLGWNLSHGQWWGVVSWLKKNEILTAMINGIIMGY